MDGITMPRTLSRAGRVNPPSGMPTKPRSQRAIVGAARSGLARTPTPEDQPMSRLTRSLALTLVLVLLAPMVALPVEVAAGDSVEKAVSAAQRVLTREKISAGIGSWLSSFTLGVTEVAERLQVPWLSLSYADSITERGFKYTFQTSPVSSLQAEQALDLVTELAKKNNRPIKKAAIVGDNTAATVFFFKPLKEKLLAAKGIELVVDEVWTPPLADATAIAQKLRATQPDIVFYGATNFPDSIQVLQKVKEF